MPSWSSIVQQPVTEPAAPEHATPSPAAVQTSSTAVVDANAVIGGTDLRSLAETLTTVPEVLEECRDAQAQQRLALLPEGLQTQRPSEEALKAGEQHSEELAAHAPLMSAMLQCTPSPSRPGSCTACRALT